MTTVLVRVYCLYTNWHMNVSATLAIKLIRAFRKAYGRKWSFLGTFGIVFVVGAMIAGQLGILPDASKGEAPVALSTLSTSVTHAAEDSSLVAGALLSTLPHTTELPVSIDIPAIGLSVDVANPTSTNIEVLDKELLNGAVRYPTSASLGGDGNVIIFGHSSYLPIVHNSAYKTFNNIQKLTAGNLITVRSIDRSYIYMVASVEKENADSSAGIPLKVESPRLTLATCDSFGTKSDRFIVTAVLVESQPLSK